jgi:23S rRNA (uracil1939-C5)-methyltransferase
LKGEGDQSFFPPPEKDRFTVYARGGLFLGEGGTVRGKTQILDRELVLDAGVFFQSNGMMLEKLVTDLQEIAAVFADASAAASAAGTVRNLPMADLYCGVGTFAVFLGEFFPHADLVEENKTALALARENFLPIVSGGNISAGFFAQRGEDWIKNADFRRYGFIIADPPRHGLAPEIARRLAADGPPLFVYVSCDPATLARDSKILLAGGYKLKELRLYDFYPQTAHIESLAVFVR